MALANHQIFDESVAVKICILLQLKYIFLLQMDYINTSHPNFIGGSKAVEIALQQVKSSRIAAPVPRLKVNASFAVS